MEACQTEFVRKFNEWVAQAGFSQVLVIARYALFFHLVSMRRCVWMMNSCMCRRLTRRTPFLYLRPVPATNTPISEAASDSLPVFQPHTHEAPGIPPLPGSGIARKLLGTAPPYTTALLMFCAEGDNRMDAQALIEKIALLCNLPLRM